MSTYRNESEIRDMEKTADLIRSYPDYLHSFLRSIEFTTTPKTRLEYAKDLCKFLDYTKDALGSCSIDALKTVTKEYIEEYLHYLKMYEKDGKILTNSTASVKRKLAAVRSLWNYLFESDLLPTNVLQKVKLPKLKDHEIIRMDQVETASFIQITESGGKMTKKQRSYHQKQAVRDLAISYLLLSTGIRVSECVGLDTTDVDFRNHCIHITRKGGKSDVVWYSDEAAEYLEDYYEQRKKIDTDTKAMFLSSRKTRLSVRAIEEIVKKYARQAVPLKKITPHKLRATYATALYEETGDIYLVGENLGHSDISTTKKHYANLSEKRKEQARNRVRITKSEE